MSRMRGGLGSQLSLAGAAALTTWVAMWSWRGFTQMPGRFLGPLFVLAALVAGIGALARWWRAPWPAVLGLQALVGGMVASAMLCGSPVPVGPAYSRLLDAFRAAVDSSQTYAAPVPAHAPGVHPLLIAGGLLCVLLVDALACTLRRVPLAGLPLLMVYSIPVSLLGGGVTWWVFAATAAGFLGLLFLQENEAVARWGRPLGEDPATADPTGFGVRTGAIKTSATTIGGVATALAVFVPFLVPTFGVHLFNLGQGPGGNDEISIENPMTDLRRDLVRGADFPVVRVTTDDPNPSYLRISVLDRFNDNEWTSGDRTVPTNNLPDGDMPPLQGVSSAVARTTYNYDVTIEDAFDSTWLPTQFPISNIQADGDWRYDTSTMDFIAGDKDLTTAGMHYTMTAVKLNVEASALALAPSSAGQVSKDFVQLPTGIPVLVRQLAQEVTREAPSRFEKAVALQRWFRETGGFTYDLHSAVGNGTDELVSFLSTGDGGRTGYCEQFASAMAVMARELGIPARVAVGFLLPRQVSPQTYEYSSYDLHAWPELFFPGSGWVRFEPTPSERARTVPSYTTQDVPVLDPTIGSTAVPENGLPSRGSSSQASASPSADKASARGDTVAPFPWAPVAGGLAALALVAALLVLPRFLRRRRRQLRLAGGPEDAWAELRATALDLGVPWPEARSPRETRDVLVEFLGAPVGSGGDERPAHGPAVAPGAVQCLDRIVRALELLRYARGGDGAGSAALRTEAETCVAALEGGASRGARRRAEWWPRSVLTKDARRAVGVAPRPEETRYGGVVDHVG
ncbi:DUF3488 and transglutaminase-like domain-containing protein [Nocardioides sp. LS1]|uniref:transglutaminase family protein n=1 Tax=Nocardioides sp. LS1 TaxID=1027620 RepID=UPI000F618DF3|nr:DUF3488 and transglutaminase-like domain-containing protein [Nocardioides sp. LS1]